MILSGEAIAHAVRAGLITIDPFDLERDGHRINPASIDLTLGDEVVTYEHWNYGAAVVDVANSVHTVVRRDRIPPDGIVLHPHRGYLLHTRERVATRHFVPVLDGKSSLGRLFLMVHVTAGYGDPGFDGQYTLEVVALAGAVRVYAGMRVAQMRFHTIADAAEVDRAAAEGVQCEPYAGAYVGAASTGSVPSKFWATHQRDLEREAARKKEGG